jgi:hypothetical protein
MKIKCKSIPDRFRRAGMVFSSSPEEYEVNEKTLKALQNEPMLIVEILPEEKKDPEKEKAQGKDQSGKKDKEKEK